MARDRAGSTPSDTQPASCRRRDPAGRIGPNPGSRRAAFVASCRDRAGRTLPGSSRFPYLVGVRRSLSAWGVSWRRLRPKPPDYEFVSTLIHALQQERTRRIPSSLAWNGRDMPNRIGTTERRAFGPTQRISGGAPKTVRSAPTAFPAPAHRRCCLRREQPMPGRCRERDAHIGLWFEPENVPGSFRSLKDSRPVRSHATRTCVANRGSGHHRGLRAPVCAARDGSDRSGAFPASCP